MQNKPVDLEYAYKLAEAIPKEKLEIITKLVRLGLCMNAMSSGGWNTDAVEPILEKLEELAK